MKGYPVGNGTSIFKKLESFRDSSANMAEYLDRAASALRGELGVKIWFCELMGKRWSHMAGEGVIMSAGIRGIIPGSSRFGYILEADPEADSTWDDALFAISEHLESFSS